MTRKIYHVTKTSSGWQGKVQGGKKASNAGDNKGDVLSETIRIAKNQGNSQVIIHKSNGKFQEERTYPKSSDPTSSKG